MKNALKIFNDYVKKYDLTDKEIMKKYHHSLRVMEIANKIATSLNLSEEEINNIKEEIPLEKIGKAQDIEKCVEWLIEDEYTTGQVISINGGWGI